MKFKARLISLIALIVLMSLVFSSCSILAKNKEAEIEIVSSGMSDKFWVPVEIIDETDGTSISTFVWEEDSLYVHNDDYSSEQTLTFDLEGNITSYLQKYENSIMYDYKYKYENGNIALREMYTAYRTERIVYDCDDACRITQKTTYINDVVDERVEYIYNEKGELVSIIEDGRVRYYNYNRDNIEVTFESGGGTWSIQYKYNKDHCLEKIGNSGEFKDRFEYDENGNMVKFKEGETYYTIKWIEGNKVQHKFARKVLNEMITEEEIQMIYLDEVKVYPGCDY